MKALCTRAAIGAGAGVLLWSGTARADGFDVAGYFLRVGFNDSPVITLLVIVGFLVADYALNFLVIGIPAVRWGMEPAPRVARGLVFLTLLGQIADRLGALLAIPALALVALLYRPAGASGAWGQSLLVCNFVLSGIAVGLLAYRFLSRRWGVPPGRARLLALGAGILTNPAWVLALWLR